MSELIEKTPKQMTKRELTKEIKRTQKDSDRLKLAIFEAYEEMRLYNREMRQQIKRSRVIMLQDEAYQDELLNELMKRK